MNEAKVLDVINQFKNTGKTFAEFIGEVFKDKLVEVYLGDSYEELSTEQVSISYPSVICGKVVGSFRECLVLNCAYVENSNKLNISVNAGTFFSDNSFSVMVYPLA
jgi:hypothetical protein